MISRKNKTVDHCNQSEGPPDKKLKAISEDMWEDDDDIEKELSKIDDVTLSQYTQPIDNINKEKVNNPIKCYPLSLINSSDKSNQQPLYKENQHNSKDYQNQLDDLKVLQYQKDGEIQHLRDQLKQASVQLNKCRQEKTEIYNQKVNNESERFKMLQKELDNCKSELAFKNHDLTQSQRICKELEDQKKLFNLSQISPSKTQIAFSKPINNTDVSFPSKKTFLHPNLKSPLKESPDNTLALSICNSLSEDNLRLLLFSKPLSFHFTSIECLLTKEFLQIIKDDKDSLQYETAINILINYKHVLFEDDIIAAANIILPIIITKLEKYPVTLLKNSNNQNNNFFTIINVLINFISCQALIVNNWFNLERNVIKMQIDDEAIQFSSPISLLCNFLLPNSFFSTTDQKFIIYSIVGKFLLKVAMLANTIEQKIVLIKLIFFKKNISDMLKKNDLHQLDLKYIEFCIDLVSLLSCLLNFKESGELLCSRSKGIEKVSNCVIKKLLQTLRIIQDNNLYNEDTRLEISDKMMIFCETIAESYEKYENFFCLCNKELPRCFIQCLHSIYRIMFNNRCLHEINFLQNTEIKKVVYKEDSWLRRGPLNNKERKLVILFRRGLVLLKRLEITFSFVKANCQNVWNSYSEIFQAVEHWLFEIKPQNKCEMPLDTLLDLGFKTD